MSQAYPYPCHVHPASFISIKLSGNTNYRQWEEQMMCLVDSHDMLGFIDGTLKESQEIINSEKKLKYREWKRSDTLVKGWIFGSLNEDVMATAVGLDTAHEVWQKLKATYSTPASSSITTNIENSQAYPYPSHVNAASFVSIMLSGESNYLEWEEQMLCLVESYDMLGFIDGTLDKSKYREWKRSDTLVKGWIFGSLCEDVMVSVVGLQTAKEVWNKLKNNYSTNYPTRTTFIDTTSYLPLYRAIVRGDLEKVLEIFSVDKDALTAKLTDHGYSALHIAVDDCEKIRFVESLLREIDPESLPTLLTNDKYNPLHCAAMIGNTKAAKMLVDKNPYLLFIVDNTNWLPIERALVHSHINTFQYLLDVCIQHIGLCQQEGCHSPFEGNHAAGLLSYVIGTGYVDVAYELIKKYPDMARAKYGRDIPLLSLARK